MKQMSSATKGSDDRKKVTAAQKKMEKMCIKSFVLEIYTMYKCKNGYKIIRGNQVITNIQVNMVII